MKKNRFLALLLAGMMCLSLAACGGEPAAPAEEEGEGAASGEATVLKLGTTVNTDDSFQVAAEKFAELVEERTEGAYTIEIHPNGDLGDERTLLESMQMGTLELGIITSGPFVNFSKDMGVLDMPFLFSSNEDVYKILDGEIGQELLDTLESANLKGLAYAERGFRNLTNSVRPVEKAEDVKDLKIRVMENPIYTEAFKAMGVNAVPMAWSDALTAFQQSTVQGQENPINVIYSYKLWESQKYATLTRHAYASAIITMSKQVFDGLPEDVQTIFLEAAQEAAEYERQWTADHEAEQLQAMKDNNMEVCETPDLESFQTAVQSVYDAHPEFEEYITRIQEALS